MRFDALGGIHDKHCAFTSLERTAHFVAEIHVAWCVNEIDLVFLIILRGVIHAYRGGLDRHAFFAFKVHRVEHLLGHITIRDCARELEQAVSEC